MKQHQQPYSNNKTNTMLTGRKDRGGGLGRDRQNSECLTTSNSKGIVSFNFRLADEKNARDKNIDTIVLQSTINADATTVVTDDCDNHEAGVFGGRHPAAANY